MEKRSRLVLFGLIFTSMMSVLMTSCSSDEIDRAIFPLSVDIFYSVDDKQVAFQGLTHSASSWSWDFGDGETSTEQNPVHVYESGGFYTAILTATDGSGNTEMAEVQLAIALTPYVLLTGGPTAANGKTWKLSARHSAGGDYFANADADLSVVDGTPSPLPDGVFDLQFGYGDIYKDEFTFHFDGTYEHDLKDDGASFGGIVYQLATIGGTGIINADGADFGLSIALFSPESNASFTYVENEDLTVQSVYGAGGALTFTDVATLDFSGTEFIGFLDFQRKVMVNEINSNSMQLVMFMAASPDFIGFNTHALILSFEVVN